MKEDSIHFLLAGVICLTLLAVNRPLYADKGDLSYRESVEIKIRERRSKFELETFVAIDIKYHSIRSAKQNQYFIYEPAYSRVTNLEAKLRGKSINRNRITAEVPNVEDVFMTDDKVYVITLPDDIRPGDKFSYSYDQEYQDIAFLPILEIPNVDIDEYNVVVKHPKDVTADFECFFPWGEIVSSVDKRNEKETILSFSSIEAKQKLAYFPYNDCLAAVLVKLRRGNDEINPTSVPAFVRWYGNLKELRPVFQCDNDADLSGALSQSSTPVVKVAAIHDWVRGNVRYIADWEELGAFLPNDPAEVYERRYGDCKDRTYLASALARAGGIEVSMALISTTPTLSFEGTHITLFDHVICAATVGDECLFFDPTAKYCGFNNLPDEDIGADALILDPRKPRVQRVDVRNHYPSIVVKIRAEVDTPTKGTAKVTLYNDYFSAAVHAQRELTAVNLENFLSNAIASGLYQISVDYLKYADESDTSISFDATADLSKFFVPSRSRIYIPKAPFATTDNDVLLRENDDLAIYFDKRKHAVLDITLSAPEHGASPDSLIIAFDDDNKLTSLLTVIDSNTVNINYEFCRRRKKVEPNEKNQFLGFLRDCLASRKAVYIIDRRE